ncbi:hypothetical protein B0J14DRAFT_570854 [Halenospora varia]|nr:hypothetical protein B0J14DRAFT_570854 [Halenospora varia]
MSLISFSKWLLSKLGSMDTLSCIYHVLNSKWPLTTSFIMRHLIYPHIFPQIPFVGTATRFKVLIMFLYILTNSLIVVIGVKSEIGSRAATMSIINLIPLLCSPRLSLVTKLLGISLRTSISSHQWFGRTAIVQVLVHMIVILTGGHAFTWTTNNLIGVVAGKFCPWIHPSPFGPAREARLVDVTVPRPWHVKAGQFVFLSIPKLGIFTGLCGHPFMILWWERDQKGLTITLLVKSRAGFTAELDRHRNQCLRAFIDGPFGVRHDFGECGTVIMIATGIGIAGHIPYIKELVKRKKDLEHGDHSRVRESFGPLDMVTMLIEEFKNQRGQIIVSFCADKAVADKTQMHV